MTRSLLTRIGIILLAAGLPGRAADDAAHNKLRDTLRATMLQLRTAETERSALQAEKAELETKSKTLAAQLEALTKQAAAERETSEKIQSELKAKLEATEAEGLRLSQALEKWKAGYQKAADLARTKEGDRAKAASQVIVLERRVADQQRKNAEMHRLGLEILDRYEKFGLGTALLAREPFVGTTRVKFENLIQDYGDKLADQRIKP